MEASALSNYVKTRDAFARIVKPQSHLSVESEERASSCGHTLQQ